ncbi:hypothetical protein [Brucella anthropi]|uniref:hypothetical protein n=1 Tax=Brucella anthropi TaxID=529 RepID=UPI001AEC9CE8|nr:hypothetical protein [Brucella anthropi]
MEASERAVGAMQAYLRLKRYILPSGIAREALQAAIPFLSQPSAARELALYEGDDICARLEGLASWLDGSQHSKWCGRKEVPIHGYSGEGKLVRAAIAAIRALSSPVHADAGKVEGDGWTVEYEVYSGDEWQAASTDLDGALDYADMYAADGLENITVQEVRRRTLPSAPSQEVAGS